MCTVSEIIQSKIFNFQSSCILLLSGSMNKNSAIFIMLVMTTFFVKQTSGCCCDLRDVARDRPIIYYRLFLTDTDTDIENIKPIPD